MRIKSTLMQYIPLHGPVLEMMIDRRIHGICFFKCEVKSITGNVP